MRWDYAAARRPGKGIPSNGDTKAGADFGFASYHSKTEANGNKLRYTRTFEVREVTVPLAQVDNLKKLYRMTASDERNTAVIKPAGN